MIAIIMEKGGTPPAQTPKNVKIIHTDSDLCTPAECAERAQRLTRIRRLDTAKAWLLGLVVTVVLCHLVGTQARHHFELNPPVWTVPAPAEDDGRPLKELRSKFVKPVEPTAAMKIVKKYLFTGL